MYSGLRYNLRYLNGGKFWRSHTIAHLPIQTPTTMLGASSKIVQKTSAIAYVPPQTPSIDGMNGLYNSQKSSISATIIPIGLNQQRYTRILNDHSIQIILAVGARGTGKTFFACATAAEYLFKGKIKNIIIAYQHVDSSINGQIPEYLLECVRKFYSSAEIDGMIQSKRLCFYPLHLLIGRTFCDTFIIADDVQFYTPYQLNSWITHLGKGSRMIITRDIIKPFASDIDRLIYQAESTPMSFLRIVRVDYDGDDLLI